MREALFILYVRDQTTSTKFYERTLSTLPRLNVPGMTEFQLTESSVLGLMPEAGIKRLLPNMPDPASGGGAPRAELYLYVDDPAVMFDAAVAAGAKSLDPLKKRDWGDKAAYCLDPDGHVVAFASPAAPINPQQ
ncbi:MAG: glyoxalase [Deltaproteobacteria bacterium RIFOXYA12_FULL_58_15]|nr:MAG: glyoxalase [Deltaproteobacteria bacterium RIFOXYA12_FULL_58_15]OGR12549.1 MAG: glyoxalase [Deltaproteobacteria bacterium RIFOXYB12_FULL_58_9]